ncbi:MAG TPA: hypothetical protein VMF29_04775 [Candidatus Edwardsbacteria bacterium]|nr:hypothetical protein [Candidatus Edwardsbacteria bacterium]
MPSKRSIDRSQQRCRRLAGRDHRLARKRIKERTTAASGGGLFSIIEARRPAGRAR